MGAKVLSGLFAPGNESAEERKVQIPGRSHTPTAFMQNGFEQLNAWLSSLHSLLIRQVALVIAITS